MPDTDLTLEQGGDVLLEQGGNVLLEEVALPLYLNVLVDWDGDGDFDDTGEDVTQSVDGIRGITWTRGKDQIREFAPSMVGRLDFSLINVDGTYSPNNSSSSIYPLVQGGKKVQIQASGGEGEALEFVTGDPIELVEGGTLETQGTSGRVIFTAFIDDVDPHPEVGLQNVDFPCFGSFTRLVEKFIDTPLFENVLTSDFITAVLDAAGWPADERSIDTGLTTLNQAWADRNRDAFEWIKSAVLTEGPGAYFYEDPNGFFVFKNRDARTTETRSTTPQATFSTATNVYGFTPSSNKKDTIQAATVSVVTREKQGQSVVWELGTDLTLTAGQTKRFQITNSDPFVDLQIPSAAPSDTVQTLTADVDLTGGTFYLRFREVTSASSLAYNATASDIQTALEALSTIGSGQVVCEGGPISTDPVMVRFTGTLAGQNITDLIEVVNSALNPVSAPATIEVVEEVAGNGILSEKQSLRPSAPLTGGTYQINLPEEHPFTTGVLNYNDNAATVQAAIRVSGSWGSVTVTGGPLSDGVPFVINLIYSADLPLATITGTVTASVGTTSISVAVTTQGGIPDYVITAGTLDSKTLNRTSGSSAQLTLVAGPTGCTLTGLRVRGRLFSVVRTQQASFPEDTTDIPTGKIQKPEILPEISLDFAQEYVEMFVDHYSVARPTATIMTITAINDPDNDALYAREIGDMIHIVDALTGIDNDYHIEQIRQSIDGMTLITEFGCEQAVAVVGSIGAPPPVEWF